jgi:BMFP domain-containing protein YqiC
LTGLGRRPKLAQKELQTMDLDPKNLDELARKLSESVPPGLIAVRDDLERNFKAVLQSGLSRLDLVTRQEFDVQAGVLRRTRERLEQLEARLAALEETRGG